MMTTVNPKTSTVPMTDASALTVPCDTFTLENGLTVIVHENHQAPVVAVNVWYRVGAKDEPAGKTGFAHLFEHLMFGGSGNLPGSYLERMTEAGALTVNGTTNRDRTNYYQTVPLEALDFALFAESDRMGHFMEGLNQSVLDRQLKVVLNEKQEREGAPYGMVPVRITKACFPSGHPYAHTVLGEEADLKNATLEDARGWFRRWYNPSNAVLTLAGAIDLASAKEKISRFFAHIPAGEPLQRPSTWVSPIAGGRREVLEDRVPHGRVVLSWNLPPWGDEATTALLLLPNILTQGVLSVMHRRLVHESGLAAFVNAWIEPGQVCSQLSISAQVQSDGDPAELEAAMLDILAAFNANGPTVETLDRVRDLYLNNMVKSYSTVTDIADLLSSSYGMLGDAQGFSRMMNAVAAIDCETIRSTAARWLNEDRYTLHVVPFTARSAEPLTAPRAVPPVELTGDLTFPAPQRAMLTNGIMISFAARLQQPETLISLTVPRGTAWDGFAAPGAGQLLSHLLNESGAGDLSAEELVEQAERLGADIDISIGQDHLFITLRALTARLEPALALFATRVRDSRFSEQEFDRARRRQINRLESQLNAADGIVSLLLSQTLFAAGHPYAQPMFGAGTPASLATLTFAGLKAHQQRLLIPIGAQLTVVGSADFDAVVSQLQTLLGDWRLPDDGTELTLPAFSTGPAGVWLVDKPGVAQTTLAAATLLPRLEGLEDTAFTLLHEILLNGFASRLNTSLREEHNWTYGVNSILTLGRAARVHGLFTSVQTDSSAAALAEIWRQLAAISGDRPVTMDELEKFRRSELLRLRGGAEGVGQLMNALRFTTTQQLPDDYWHIYARDLAALTLADLQRLAEVLVNPQHMVWIVVGDLTQLGDSLDVVLPTGLPRYRLKESELPGLRAKTEEQP
ncbi:hypothetical protein WM46_15310 [Citrobacter freundii complex sp. CFNIH2]|uniref:M16 family metallopeptidase n=1 Tax=Citrobacter freundii complex sp. CFNIH2 TaxID=2066049 RepID=UPI000C86D7FE|nr:pitrilysin family protein [Citrobacter freundii complex sp. CFNIH2]AUO66014.1 hypothetical protein WM46_15310 [Citrobacter freundii complex sp. CFNIH2]